MTHDAERTMRRWMMVRLASSHRREDDHARPIHDRRHRARRRRAGDAVTAPRRSTRRNIRIGRGQWKRPRGVGTQWDQTKPSGLAPAGAADAGIPGDAGGEHRRPGAGGQGSDTRVTCVTNGMPRIMTVTFADRIRDPAGGHLRPFREPTCRAASTPTAATSRPDEEPSYLGYSIGKWIDKDGDGRYDTLEVETRNFKGPRTYENSGLPLHADNQTDRQGAHLARQGEQGPPARRDHHDRPRADAAVDGDEDLSPRPQRRSGTRTIAARTTITWWSARRTTSSAPTAF